MQVEINHHERITVKSRAEAVRTIEHRLKDWCRSGFKYGWTWSESQEGKPDLCNVLDRYGRPTGQYGRIIT